MKVIDTERLFEINVNCNVNVCHLPNNLVAVEFDNFYVRPDEIADYFKTLSVSEQQTINNVGYPDLRYEQKHFFNKKYFHVITDMLEQHMSGIISCTSNGEYLTSPENNIVVNHMQANTLCDEVNNMYLPHVDPILITGIIPFTKTLEGTSLFRHRHTNCVYFVDEGPTDKMCKKYYYKILKNSRDQHHHEMTQFKNMNMGTINSNGENVKNEPILTSNDDFEILHTSSGKYNSAFFFAGSVLHSSACKRPAINERTVQVLTLK